MHSTGGALSDYEGLVFSEVMAANRTAMPDENGNYPDWLEIWNSSDHAINLKDVGLSNKGTSIKFLFPDMELAAGERVIVLCDKKNQAIAGKPMHAKFSISSNGEELYIYDPNAYLIDSVKPRFWGWTRAMRACRMAAGAQQTSTAPATRTRRAVIRNTARRRW